MNGQLAMLDVEPTPEEGTPRCAPSDEPILAASPWPTNGALIADVARLGYLEADDRVLDPTYGKGNWWTEWKPAELTHHDIRDDGIDFRNLPYPEGTFDAVAFDPPYVSVGGRQTTGLPGMHDAYGLTDAPTSPAELQVLINDGLTEVVRVVRARGVVLVKCADYVSSGKLWPGTHHTLAHALSLGLVLEERLVHYTTTPRPQPRRRRQVHAHNNLSMLLVLRVKP